MNVINLEPTYPLNVLHFSGTNITHSAVVRPKVGIWGRFNFTAGEVSYLADEETKEAQQGFTSEPGEGFIVSLKEFDRRFSPHVVSHDTS